MGISSQLERIVKVPEGVEVNIEDGNVRVKGPKGEVSKNLSYTGVTISVKKDEVIVSTPHDSRKEKAIVGTFASHINNMVVGVTEGFEYKLKIVYAHFPISVKVSGGEILIENFLGEKSPRRVKIVGDCEAVTKGDEVTITGNNLEDVAQTAANIELGTKVKRRDPRVFQDGIYIVSKKGVELR